MSFLDFDDDDPKRAKRRPLLLFILVTLAVGGVGSAVTEPNVAGWYAHLAAPAFAPAWLFAPASSLFIAPPVAFIWTALYILMAVAAFRVWRVATLNSAALNAYWIQLALNLGWCIVFFGLHRIGAALAEMAVLLLAILAAILLFWRSDKLSGLMLLPVLAWTGYTAALNHAIWLLNR